MLLACAPSFASDDDSIVETETIFDFKGKSLSCVRYDGNLYPEVDNVRCENMYFSVNGTLEGKEIDGEQALVYTDKAPDSKGNALNTAYTLSIGAHYKGKFVYEGKI